LTFQNVNLHIWAEIRNDFLICETLLLPNRAERHKPPVVDVEIEKSQKTEKILAT